MNEMEELMENDLGELQTEAELLKATAALQEQVTKLQAAQVRNREHKKQAQKEAREAATREKARQRKQPRPLRASAWYPSGHGTRAAHAANAGACVHAACTLDVSPNFRGTIHVRICFARLAVVLGHRGRRLPSSRLPALDPAVHDVAVVERVLVWVVALDRVRLDRRVRWLKHARPELLLRCTLDDVEGVGLLEGRARERGHLLVGADGYLGMQHMHVRKGQQRGGT